MNLFRNNIPEAGPLPGLPVTVSYMPSFMQSCTIRDSSDGAGEAWLFQIPARAIDYLHDPEPYGDALAMRDALEAVSTPEEARVFLEHCGPWLPPNYCEGTAKGDSQALSWSAFVNWQRYFRDRTLGFNVSPRGLIGTSILFSHHTLAIGHLRGEVQTSLQNTRPHETINIECRCAAEAISAVIELDRKLEVNYRVCAFGGCQQLFKVGHRKDQKCCNDRCRGANAQRRCRNKKTNPRAVAH